MIDLSAHGNIAVLTLAHGKANAMDLELCEALAARLDECRGSDVAGVVITGTGRIFSAGVDLPRIVSGGAGYVRAFLPAMIAAFDAAFTFARPVVAAVNGAAIAGGCVLACAADRRIVAAGATIGVPELLVGVPFPTGALEIVRFAAARHTPALVYTGAALDAEAAVRNGLADAVVAPEGLMGAAIAEAERLAARPAKVFAMTKRLIRQPAVDRVRALSPQLDPAVVDVWASDETRQRIAEYVERTFGRRKS